MFVTRTGISFSRKTGPRVIWATGDSVPPSLSLALCRSPLSHCRPGPSVTRERSAACFFRVAPIEGARPSTLISSARPFSGYTTPSASSLFFPPRPRTVTRFASFIATIGHGRSPRASVARSKNSRPHPSRRPSRIAHQRRAPTIFPFSLRFPSRRCYLTDDLSRRFFLSQAGG